MTSETEMLLLGLAIGLIAGQVFFLIASRYIKTGAKTGASGNVMPADTTVADDESLFETAPVALCILDDEGNLQRSNRHTADLGISEADIARAVSDLPSSPIHGTNLSSVSPMVADLKTDQGTRSFALHASSLPGDESFLGTVIALVPEPIDRPKSLENRVNSIRFKTLAENMNDMIVIIGPNKVRQYVSPSSEQLLGFTADELIGQSPVAGIHPDDRAATLEVSEQLFRGEISNSLTTYRHKHKDGHYVWLEASFKAIRHPETDELTEFFGTVRDVGARRSQNLRAAEQNARLKEQNRLLEMAEELANIGHWRINLEDNSVIWSDQLYRIHGIDESFALDVGKGVDFYHPEDREMVAEMVQKAMIDGEKFAFKARITRPDGNMRHVASVGHAEKSPAGEVMTIFGVFEDITETVINEERLRQSRDEAEEAAKAKSHFLANMSHEIRTPMNGVIGFADLLLEGDLEHEHAEYARMISSSGRAMIRLLNELLDLSKIGVGRMELARDQVDFGHLIRSSIRLFEPNARAKDIELSAEIAPDIPEGLADKFRVRQIILNLVGNAIKFTDEGAIKINADACDGHIAIRVSDTGPGIAKEDLARVFDEFTQIPNQSAASGDGTGLGLAIARNLAELMGGTLSATSTLGKGSTFELLLPLYQPEAGAEPIPEVAEETTAVRSGLKGRKVLLAEDAVINQKLMEAMLAHLDVEVDIAENGEEALECIQNIMKQGTQYHAVLMDMQMPVMDGLEATRRLRAQGLTGAQLPVIAITANAYADDVASCLEAGMQDHLAKPISIDLLGECLEKWIGSSVQSESLPLSVQSEIDEARGMYLQRKRALKVAVTDLNADTLSDPEIRADLVIQLHSIAGIAAHFGDAPLGDLAREAEHELKTKTDAQSASGSGKLAELANLFAHTSN